MQLAFGFIFDLAQRWKRWKREETRMDLYWSGKYERGGLITVPRNKNARGFK
jgi:hypothetical protein